MSSTVVEENDKVNSPEAHPQRERLSQILLRLFDPNRAETTLGDLVDELDHHGMAIVLILFSIPSALPIPAPGYSTLLSVPLLAIGIRLLMGRDTIWLPEGVRGKHFNPGDFQKMKSWMLRLVSFIERFSRPRLQFIASSKVFTIVLGLLICALGCFMAVPIPGTNTLPAGGIFLIGFGMLESDGLLTAAGILYAFVALVIGSLILLFGYEVVKELILQFL